MGGPKAVAEATGSAAYCRFSGNQVRYRMADGTIIDRPREIVALVFNAVKDAWNCGAPSSSFLNALPPHRIFFSKGLSLCACELE